MLCAHSSNPRSRLDAAFRGGDYKPVVKGMLGGILFGRVLYPEVLSKDSFGFLSCLAVYGMQALLV